MENLEAIAKEVKDLAASLEAREKAYDEKIENILKEKAHVDKAMIVDSKEAAAKFKGYLGARAEVNKGKTANVPLWDEKTEDQFVEWVHMVKNNDVGLIKKTFGDNAYTETTTAGGYFVPTIFKPELVRLIYQKSMMLPKVSIVPMPVSKMDLPTVTAGYSAGWGTINTQVTDSKLTVNKVSLSAEKLVALSLVPNELLQDSGIPIAPLLANEFAEAFAFKIDEEILDGDSADSSNHKFDGWSKVANTVGYGPGVDASPTIAEEATIDILTAEIAALEAANWVNLIGAEWFFAPQVWAAIRSLTAAVTNLPQVAINEPWKFNLFGFPVNINGLVPHAETALKAWGLFGNPKYIYVGDMGGLSIESSKDYRFGEDQTTFLARQRLAVAVGIPGSLGALKFGAASG